jgi:hypothetical protein
LLFLAAPGLFLAAQDLTGDAEGQSFIEDER